MSVLLSPAMSKARTLKAGWYSRAGWATDHYVQNRYSRCGQLIRDAVVPADGSKRRCKVCALSVERPGYRTRWSEDGTDRWEQ